MASLFHVWRQPLLVALVAGVCYLNTLNGGFVFDDHRGIETNDDIRSDKTSLSQLFRNDFWGGSMAREQSHKSYRPLTVLSYRWLNYALLGMTPWWFHAVNVAMHAAASGLFALVLREFRLQRAACWLGGLLFAAHSVHTEAVANTVGRAEVLAAIFFFLGVLAYARGVLNLRGGGGGGEPERPWLWLAVAVLCAALSLLSKEQGVTALAVYAAADILTHCSAATRHRRRSTGAGVAVRVATLAACAVVAMRLRLAMNQGAQPVFKPEEMRAAFHPRRAVRLLSFQYVYAWNAALLLWPAPLCCDWSLGSVPLVESPTEWRNAASLALHASLLAYGLAALHQLLASSSSASSPAAPSSPTAPSVSAAVSAAAASPAGPSACGWQAALALALLLLPFVPSSGALVTVGFVVAERVLYIPSAGWCMMVALGYQRLRGHASSPATASASSSSSSAVHRWRRLALGGAAALTLLLLAAKTLHRNGDWSTDLGLYAAGVRASPANVKLHNNHGMMLAELGRHDDAARAYRAALALEPAYHDVHFNLGNLHHAAGRLPEAADAFRFAAENPNQARRALNNLGSVLMKLKRLPDAERALRRAVASPAPGTQDNAQAYNNLASVLGERGKLAEAEAAFGEALAVRPGYVDAHFNLGTLLVHAGRLDDAERELREALRLQPGHGGAANNLEVVAWRRAHPDG